MKKVTLKEVADEIETSAMSDSMRVYYDRETGEFRFYSEEERRSYDDDEGDEWFEDERYIALPDQFDVNEYEMMMKFSRSREDPGTREKLLFAIDGKGAFRWFRRSIEELGIEEEWYAWRGASYLEIAREWCDWHKIEYSVKR